jgi:hypothetical protein
MLEMIGLILFKTEEILTVKISSIFCVEFSNNLLKFNQ